ncbi:excalibur calcium-binding domain-containing protein [Sphingomonas sp. UYP23]
MVRRHTTSISLRKPVRARSAPAKTPDPGTGRSGTRTIVSVAAAPGGIGGTGSLAFHDDGRARIVAAVKPVAVQAELRRSRAPQPGDVWGGCNAARAAGTAPIYAGEPGYRPKMDGDSDGIACEPIR